MYNSHQFPCNNRQQLAAASMQVGDHPGQFDRAAIGEPCHLISAAACAWKNESIISLQID